MGKNLAEIEKNIKDPYFWLPVIIVNVAVLSVVFLADKYTNTFSKNLSKVHSHWAEFGTFFGGILTPLISFLTLIAIIATIRLQRTMIGQQNIQILQLEDTARADKINSHKQILINELHQQIKYTKDLALFNFNTMRQVSETVKNKDERNRLLQYQVASAERGGHIVDKLLKVSINLSLEKFPDIESVDDFFSYNYNKVMAEHPPIKL